MPDKVAHTSVAHTRSASRYNFFAVARPASSEADSHTRTQRTARGRRRASPASTKSAPSTSHVVVPLQAPSSLLDATAQLRETRASLFGDDDYRHIPGNVHLQSDDSLERLIHANGAIPLLRQMASDLAFRDAQITEVRRIAEEREKKLKAMLFEAGVSRSDVERRLAAPIQRRASRESFTSSRKSIFSAIETLDDRIQDAVTSQGSSTPEETHAIISAVPAADWSNTSPDKNPDLEPDQTLKPSAVRKATEPHLHERRKQSVSVAKTQDWLPSSIRETAHSVMPNTVAAIAQPGPVKQHLELKTFIPEADQPPTMLPAWNDGNLQGKILTDRFGFKLFDERSKRREMSEAVFEVTDTRNATAMDLHLPEVSLVDGEAEEPVSPLHETLKGDALHRETNGTNGNEASTTLEAKADEAASMTTSSSHKNLLNLPLVVHSPRPLTPETSHNQPDAIFHQNDSSQARLYMLSRLDQYGADKSKEEAWESFFAKTREDRTKAGKGLYEEGDFLEDELIGLASLSNSKMAKERRKELQTLIYNGIPMSLRPKIWGECTGAYMLKEPMYYQDLLSNGLDADPICVQQIDMDVHRTMPSNVFFNGKGPGIEKLRRVLLAFSRHNPEVGYCQGMNAIAATLLLTHPTEEDAFFVLCCIVEKVLPPRYFTPDLLTSRADQMVLKHFVKELCYKLHKHLAVLGIDLEAITFGWFLSIFTDCLPAELLFRCFDILFLEGHAFLFAIAMTILRINEKVLLACTSQDQVFTLLKDLGKVRDAQIDEFIRMTEVFMAAMKSHARLAVGKLQETAVERLLEQAAASKQQQGEQEEEQQGQKQDVAS